MIAFIFCNFVFLITSPVFFHSSKLHKPVLIFVTLPIMYLPSSSLFPLRYLWLWQTLSSLLLTGLALTLHPLTNSMQHTLRTSQPRYLRQKTDNTEAEATCMGECVGRERKTVHLLKNYHYLVCVSLMLSTLWKPRGNFCPRFLR